MDMKTMNYSSALLSLLLLGSVAISASSASELNVKLSPQEKPTVHRATRLVTRI